MLVATISGIFLCFNSPSNAPCYIIFNSDKAVVEIGVERGNICKNCLKSSICTFLLTFTFSSKFISVDGESRTMFILLILGVGWGVKNIVNEICL